MNNSGCNLEKIYTTISTTLKGLNKLLNSPDYQPKDITFRNTNPNIMSTYTQILYQITFSTKNREHTLLAENRKE